MKKDKSSERLSATTAKMVKLQESMPFPNVFEEAIDNNHFLLIFTKESNQVLLFPVKSKNIVKIWCQLDELNVTFQKELISDLTDYGLTDVWVAGITTALDESGSLIYEGFFQTDQEVEVENLKRNIAAITDVAEVKISNVKNEWV